MHCTEVRKHQLQQPGHKGKGAELGRGRRGPSVRPEVYGAVWQGPQPTRLLDRVSAILTEFTQCMMMKACVVQRPLQGMDLGVRVQGEARAVPVERQSLQGVEELSPNPHQSPQFHLHGVVQTEGEPAGALTSASGTKAAWKHTHHNHGTPWCLFADELPNFAVTQLMMLMTKGLAVKVLTW